ncbi:putative gp59-like protein [Esparto virus]|uniref:Putative gp59-like protein n=1 Tax=Esparto virus TaxID=2072209 RepID=A0A2I7G2Z9_9VIRU|nr:putative gp59-like protein [Esparto virus]AUQ44020.1 putative gp59-like protein [Esparto virus]
MTTRNKSDLALESTNPNLANEITTFEQVDKRDDRFKQLLYQQFGETGIVSLVNQALVFILALIMIVSIMIGMIATNNYSTNQRFSSNNTLMNLGPAYITSSGIVSPSMAALSL